MSLTNRLSVIAALAVAVAVVAVSALAFLLVREELYRQLDAQLDADARTIAAQPEQWMARAPVKPAFPDEFPGEWHRFDKGDIGPQWQIISVKGVANTSALPITEATLAVLEGRAVRSRETVPVDGEQLRMVTLRLDDRGTIQVAQPLDPLNNTLRRLALLLALGCLGGAALAALLGRSVARAGLAPIHQLTGAVEKVAATRDLQTAIPVHGRDEVARLAGAFNGMLAALTASRAAQRALVEDAGHELRTPLTSLRTNIELLVRAEADPDRVLPAQDRVRLMQDLETQVVELTQLTNELVDLAREETSPEEAELVDLADVVAAAIDRARSRTAVPIDAALVTAELTGRPGALERMVLNLLDNAAKWSPAGGRVGVRLRAGGEQIELTVVDEGPGIDDADRLRVFERFYRSAAARAMPGSGLGLAIVAQTVAQHGGAVTAERAPAGGALLRVLLPSHS
ncbi:HAMP domain-containing sensor histidine kinase [Catellatospora citrea]|uniref:histidine kinase n=1 Tax=Catellatospora citrea TaxID=53366 RepID=A0A8J3P203_9ACTN|nr:HAMP domain-containing sensor histidine kinase [Catellatospora citrea]RKE12152.1 two-component system sensor histidine kinase MprB [Catellatospora citrea]GIF98885.1 two-component sensor histidine kinase [Catellatospora citrea]